MTETFRAADHMVRLKDFQRATVRHVVQRMYDDPEPTRRFLVADETGLGKSVVARGVIAEVVERLLEDDSVQRIDVIYVCSNADIASQNLKRLNVVGNKRVEFRTRLTMLASQAHDLNSKTGPYSKPVNLIAFTPATSFEKGWRTGKRQERALLVVILSGFMGLSTSELTALHRILQGTVRSFDNFRWLIRTYDDLSLDETITKEFKRVFLASPHRSTLLALIAEVTNKRSLSQDQRYRAGHLIGNLRSLLAQASVHALEPDLIILDEFQRFRHLLDPDKGTEATELAHSHFEWDEARTLLLSATPYKPFTLAEEDADGEGHYANLMLTLNFLSSCNTAWLNEVKAAFAEFRLALLAGAETDDITALLRDLLLQHMCRTERPAVPGAHREITAPADKLTAQDLADFVGLRELARSLESSMQVEYWKSAPYFVNFLEGYQVGDRLKAALKKGKTDEDIRAALALVAALDPTALEQFQQVDMGNARLRSLADWTVKAGWWQLLWIPPSLPYLRPAGPYAEDFAQQVTKQLVFSSWSATPTAIAGLLSYEADRQLADGSTRLTSNTAEARRRLGTRLTYSAEDGRPAGMSTLALFWPHPALADLADPLRFSRADNMGTPPTFDGADWAYRQLSEAGGDPGEQPVADLFAWPGALPASVRAQKERRIAARILGTVREGDDDDQNAATQASRLDAHVAEVLAAETEQRVSQGLAELAMHSPGNIAWRALGRLVNSEDEITDEGHWYAAAVLANGLRSLFNRVESSLLLDRLYAELPYWRAVLTYCAAGNLQAVLDEYLHHQRSNLGDECLSNTALADLAEEAVGTLSMRPSRYVGFHADEPARGIPLGSRFALRYGAARAQADDVRMPEVRAAFNSPFWPFVLASTSVGQEGIDFHWWCHSVVHWNTPASPVDFEQREGRVNRFGGHAVRRNIAIAHRADVMASKDPDPWRAAYEAAKAEDQGLGDFSPYWVYPGPHAVERHLLPFPLSQDGPRASALKRDLMHYRLALGQPRQEDFLAMMARTGRDMPRPIDLSPARPPRPAALDK